MNGQLNYLARPKKKRKFKKYFAIAYEGEKTEYLYFSALADTDNLSKKNIFVYHFPSEYGKSAPSFIIENLSNAEKNFIEGYDELWLLIDRDKQSWDKKQIKEIAAQCEQKKFGFALSNPCFEIWLLMHFEDIADADKKRREILLENEKTGKKSKKSFIEKELSIKIRGYNKTNLANEKLLPKIPAALKNSKKNSTKFGSPDERWPDYLGSHVHLLVESLLSNKN